MLFILTLGMFLDGGSITVLTVPVIAPMLPVQGVDTVAFGVILMTLIETALLTPPVGLNLPLFFLSPVARHFIGQARSHRSLILANLWLISMVFRPQLLIAVKTELLSFFKHFFTTPQIY